MQTHILEPNKKNIKLCAKALKRGEIAAFPTETVYGLGASVYNENALKKIFTAKGRPSDNPLIVHICEKSELKKLTSEIPLKAVKLMDKFMPGALTIIFKKSDAVSKTVTGGLDTVAVRMPKNDIALSLIRECGFPLAAPSANKSGLPSATTAKHVFDDLNGRIEYILDGGECEIGLESTVIDVTTDPPRLLRNGGVTIEEIEKEIGVIEIFKTGANIKALSPGMKYKHYSPKAEVYFSAFYEKMSDTIVEVYDRLKNLGRNPVILCLESRINLYGVRETINIGKNYKEYAHNLFSALRYADSKFYDAIIAEGVDEGGIGATIINRLVKSSGGQVI